MNKLIKKILILPTILLFFLILLPCCTKKNKDNNKDNKETVIKVNSYMVNEEELIPEIRTFGTISFKSKVDIHPKTSGRIEKINVTEGQRVYKSQILATLEQFQLLLEKSQAISELDAANSSLSLAKEKYNDALRNMERQFLTIEKSKAELEDKKNTADNLKNTLVNKKKLLDAGAVTEESIKNLEAQYHTAYTQYVISERDLKIQEIGFRDNDIIEAGYKIPNKLPEKIELLKKINAQTLAREVEVAESRVKIAETKLDSVNSYLQETFIKSPANGIVASKDMEIGEEAKPDKKLFTIMNTETVYAKINISESDLARVKPNGEVIISVDALGKKEFTGSIELISPIIDAKTRTIQLSVILPNSDSKLIPGMFVRANIKSNEKRNTIFIPASSLISVEKDDASVFIIKKGIAFKKEIKIGPEKDDNIEIIAGLKNGDIIVDNPPIDLIEGNKVEVINEKVADN